MTHICVTRPQWVKCWDMIKQLPYINFLTVSETDFEWNMAKKWQTQWMKTELVPIIVCELITRWLLLPISESTCRMSVHPSGWLSMARHWRTHRSIHTSWWKKQSHSWAYGSLYINVAVTAVVVMVGWPPAGHVWGLTSHRWVEWMSGSTIDHRWLSGDHSTRNSQA